VWSFKGTNATLANALPSTGQKSNQSNSTTSLSTPSVPSATGHIVIGVVQTLFGAEPGINGTQDGGSANATTNRLSWAYGHQAGAGSVTVTGTQSPADQMLVAGVDVSP
jgi:hypothetical protein